MELFDFIKVLFTDPGEYSKVPAGEKRKQFFMIQRRMAINFPLQASVLQQNKINQSAVVDFWQRFVRKQYKYVPGWMYTKGVKKAQEFKEKKTSVSESLITEYSRYFKIDRKSIVDALEFYPDQMIKQLKDFEKIINQK
jgi:hypothetical protein